MINNINDDERACGPRDGSLCHIDDASRGETSSLCHIDEEEMRGEGAVCATLMRRSMRRGSSLCHVDEYVTHG